MRNIIKKKKMFTFHIVVCVFGPIRFLLPVCRFCWFLYTLNIYPRLTISRSVIGWSLWPNIRFLPSIVAEKNVTKNVHICSMCIKINKVGKQEVGIWRVQKRFPQYGIPIWIVTFFSATIDGRNLIFGHKLHIGTPYRGKRFWSHQIPTSCLPILLIFIHI
jgi:hypothetical protein